ncbi:MAG: hypothetical protein H6766_07160 [Candidatus Peribacteria bacterium]|nr:MAG: hypothetical protein H6766_07160 [Candidatus Peribacteria bacterium]
MCGVYGRRYQIPDNIFLRLASMGGLVTLAGRFMFLVLCVMSSIYHPDLSHVSHDDKYYSLTMFPYPSGYGLHVGHASCFVINDVNARYHMLQGKKVLNPMGFDSF